jgi:hypothetical protein
MTNTDDTSQLEASKDALKTAAEDRGEPLSRNDYDSWRASQDDVLITSATIIEQVGNSDSWVAACEALGIAAPFTESHYTTKMLKIAVKEAVEAMREPLTMAEYDLWRDNRQDTDYPTSTTIANSLGDGHWSQALKTVGIEPGTRAREPQYTSEDLENALREAVDAVGDPLTHQKYRQWRSEQDGEYPSSGPIKKHLGDGTWSEAVRSVGGSPGEMGGRRWDESDAKEALNLFSEEFAELLTTSDYKSWRTEQDEDHPSVTTISNKIGDGSWVAALDIVGLQAGNVPTDE